MRACALALAASLGGALLLLNARRRWRRREAKLAASLCQPCEQGGSEAKGSPREPWADTRRQLRFDGVDTPQTQQRSRTAQSGKEGDRISLVEPAVGHSRDPDATTKRSNYISWDDYFMAIAVLSSFRSKDPNRQVGACIIDPALRRIVGIGYNGFPIGCGDDDLPWAREGPSSLETKYAYVCHAEMNAIMNKNAASLENCRIYVTLFPCNECAKLIIQSRLSEVVFFSDKYHDTEMMAASRRMFKLAGIRTWQHKPAISNVLVDFEGIR